MQWFASLSTAQAQQITFAGIVLITFAIVFLDVAMIRYHGREASISHLMVCAFERCPVGAALFFLWLGIWIGHTYLFHGHGD